jgi:hypothetical protein
MVALKPFYFLSRVTRHASQKKEAAGNIPTASILQVVES